MNCNSSPDHRCCKYAEEEGEKEDEKPEEVAKDAPVEQEEQVLIMLIFICDVINGQPIHPHTTVNACIIRIVVHFGSFYLVWSTNVST